MHCPHNGFTTGEIIYIACDHDDYIPAEYIKTVRDTVFAICQDTAETLRGPAHKTMTVEEYEDTYA